MVNINISQISDEVLEKAIEIHFKSSDLEPSPTTHPRRVDGSFIEKTNNIAVETDKKTAI